MLLRFDCRWLGSCHIKTEVHFMRPNSTNLRHSKEFDGMGDLLHRSTIQSVKASLGKGDLYSRSRELLRSWNLPLSLKHTRIYAFHSQQDINSCSSCFSLTAFYLWPWLPSRQVLILFCPKRLFSQILHQHSSSSIRHHPFIHLNPDLTFFLPPSCLLSSNFFTALSPSILTPRPSHSIIRSLITDIL